MHLFFSDDSPLNTVLSDAEGHSLYKIDTPFRTSGRTTTIHGIVPGAQTHIAQIEWRGASLARLRFRGEVIDIDSYLRPKPWKLIDLARYGPSRVFTAPNGRDYKWTMASLPKLELHDGSKTPVARFHGRHFGIFHAARPASLEILEEGEAICDVIVMTFVYVEKLRVLMAAMGSQSFDIHTPVPRKGSLKSARAASTQPRLQPLHAWSVQNLQVRQPVAPHDTLPPFPRHGHALPATASEDGDLFLFGGTFRGQSRSDLYLLSTHHPSVRLLQTEGDKPPALVGHASALVRKMVVVWGGANAAGTTDDAVYILYLDKNRREWTRCEVRGPAPVGRSNHAVTTMGYNFFIFGGLSGKPVNIRSRTPGSAPPSWKLYGVSHRPCGRTGHICFAYGNEIIIFGGTDGELYYNDTWAFNLHTEMWTELQCTGAIPSRRHSHSGALVKHRLYLFGGMANNGNLLDDLYAFDIPNRGWFKFRPMHDGPAPAGRKGHAMASMGTKIFVVGGETVSSMLEHSSIHILETDELDYSPRTAAGMIKFLPVSMLPKIYRNLFEALMAESGYQPYQTRRNALRAQAESMASYDIIANLTHSSQFRVQLLKMASKFYVPQTSIQEALEKDDQDIAHLLRNIVKSASDKKAIVQLRNQDAQTLVDLLQTVVDQGIPSDNAIHRLLVSLSEASNKLPSALFLHGVELLETIPEYGEGLVDIVRGTYRKESVAVKRLRTPSSDIERRQTHRHMCQEILLWQRLKHPRIVPLLGIDAETSSPHICMVSPWMKHGTVLRYMEANGHENVDQHILDVAEGLAYLHSENIVHGDVRGNNILINDEQHACLTDFSLSVFTNSIARDVDSGLTVFSDVHSIGRGSPRWMAPELLSDSEGFERTGAIDVWAFGCVCVELYTGEPPFSETFSDAAVMMRVINGGQPVRPLAMSDEMWAIVVRCWTPGGDRVGMDQVVDALEVFNFDLYGSSLDL